MDYQLGLKAFKEKAMGQDWLGDFLPLESRLQENLHDEARFGTAETTRQERTRIVDQLNILSLRHVGQSFNDLAAGATPRTFDVLLLVAVDDEYQAIKREIQPDASTGDWEELKDSKGNPLIKGLFLTADKSRTLSVLVARADKMGPLHALAGVYHLAREFNFGCLAMSGVCAGDADKLKVGNLVFAEEVWRMGPGKSKVSYNSGQRDESRKEDVEAKQVKPAHWSRDVEDYGKQFASDFNTLLRAYYPPNSLNEFQFEVHVGAIQTVPDVTLDEEAFKRAQLVKRKTIAIEMEGYSVALAAEGLKIEKWFVVKGVQDYGKPNVGENDKTDEYRSFSAISSALFAIEFLKKFLY